MSVDNPITLLIISDIMRVNRLNGWHKQIILKGRYSIIHIAQMSSAALNNGAINLHWHRIEFISTELVYVLSISFNLMWYFLPCINKTLFLDLTCIEKLQKWLYFYDCWQHYCDKNINNEQPLFLILSKMNVRKSIVGVTLSNKNFKVKNKLK